MLQKNEERKYGEYHTAQLPLAAYDALAAMMAGDDGGSVMMAGVTHSVG